MRFAFTGIVHIPVTIAIAIIAYRFYLEWIKERFQESFILFLAFSALSLVCFSGMLSGSVFADKSGIRTMLLLSNILLTISNAFFAYLFFSIRFPRASSWWGFSFVTLLGIITTILLILRPAHPMLEPSGGVNWGLPLDIGVLRSMIYILGMAPYAHVLFKKLTHSDDPALIKKNLLLILFFSMTILIVLFDFIIEPYFEMEAFFSEVLILILAVVGMSVYFILQERVLVRSEKKFQRLVENTHDLVCITDETFVILYANQSYQTILSYLPIELHGKNFFDLIFEDDRNFVRKKLNQEKTAPAYSSFEFRMLHADGRPLWVESFGIFYLEDPEKTATAPRLAISNRDICKRKALENSLRQAQKMEAVGLLAGGIAHDFNNLLTVINGYSELILRKMDKDDPLYNKINQIKQSGDRASSLTRQLLAFSRKQFLEPVILNINKLSANMEKMLRRLIRENIRLNTDYDPGLKCVLADPGQIEQVILNLVVNGSDALADGGEITIKTANVQLDEYFREPTSEKEARNFVMLSVADNGMGMDKKTKERIFEPFFTTKETGKGTGLGLSTVYGIIKQSHGDIQVESRPGQGAVFKVFLPVAEGTSKQKRQKPKSRDYRGTEIIFLAEDDEAVRAFTAQGLRDLGYKVFEIITSDQAIALAKEKRPRLLLTDIVMPATSGWKIARDLTRIVPSLKILFMSGYTDNMNGNFGFSMNEGNFIQKPFTIHSLVKKIREVFDQ